MPTPDHRFPRSFALPPFPGTRGRAYWRYWRCYLAWD